MSAGPMCGGGVKGPTQGHMAVGEEAGLEPGPSDSRVGLFLRFRIMLPPIENGNLSSVGSDGSFTVFIC